MSQPIKSKRELLKKIEQLPVKHNTGSVELMKALRDTDVRLWTDGGRGEEKTR